jgi:hypothetical protein
VWIWWLVPLAWQHPSHIGTIIKQFLAWRKMTVLDHPPYSPNLAPADYFLFPKVKSHLKGHLFDSVLDIQKAVTSTIKHHCKGWLLQRHPEAVWPCKPVCRVRRDVCRKLKNKSVISFIQILFIMPVLKLSRHTLYVSSHPIIMVTFLCQSCSDLLCKTVLLFIYCLIQYFFFDLPWNRWNSNMIV